MSDARPIFQKLWNYCNVLRDDGVSYQDYLEQLTTLLFLKMADERAQVTGQPSPIPKKYSWSALIDPSMESIKLEEHYRTTLRTLSNKPGMLGLIFRKAQNKIQDPAKLRQLIVDLIDQENWSAMSADVKGDAYEGLLEKNAQDVKGGAGQYFTPRAVIQAVTDVIRPQPGEVICDPACGTGGFLLAAHQHVAKEKLSRPQKKHLRYQAIRGVELVDGVTRLCAMNLYLHGIGPDDDTTKVPLQTADALREKPSQLYDVVVSNPPFGKHSSITVIGDDGTTSRQGITYSRGDFFVSTSNKQLNFLQHIKSILRVTGRAAVVLPDNVLFEGGAGERIRRRLMRDCDLHTILRLPTGIFYAQGVKANVLFFDNKPASEKPWTRKVWFYDLRTNKHFTLKQNPLTRADLDDFVKRYHPENRDKRRAT